MARGDSASLLEESRRKREKMFLLKLTLSTTKSIRLNLSFGNYCSITHDNEAAMIFFLMWKNPCNSI